MSELKVHNINDLSLNDIANCDFYLKSEVDKYIALLKDKVNYNEFAYKFRSKELADTRRSYEKELRHQKYKRCLMMARLCKRNRLHSSICGPVYKIDFWEKWNNRWLKIAEQFKEVNNG